MALDPMSRIESGDKLLTPSEVASFMRVHPKTVTRWAASGKLPAVLTMGGHRRYWTSDVRAALLGKGDAR